MVMAFLKWNPKCKNSKPLRMLPKSWMWYLVHTTLIFVLGDFILHCFKTFNIYTNPVWLIAITIMWAIKFLLKVCQVEPNSLKILIWLWIFVANLILWFLFLRKSNFFYDQKMPQNLHLSILEAFHWPDKPCD